MGTLPSRLASLVGRRLQRFGIEQRWIDAETAAMTPVSVAKTADRAVVGIMVDFAWAVPYHLARGGWDETTLPFVEQRLEETPCYSSRPFSEVVFPDKATPALLEAHWGVPTDIFQATLQFCRGRECAIDPSDGIMSFA